MAASSALNTVIGLSALGIGIFVFLKFFGGEEILKKAFENLKAFGADDTDTVPVVQGGTTTTTEVIKETTLIETEQAAVIPQTTFVVLQDPTSIQAAPGESLSELGARLDEQNRLLFEQNQLLAATLQTEQESKVVDMPLVEPAPIEQIEPTPTPTAITEPTSPIVANISGIGDVTLEEAQAFLSASGFESLLQSLDPSLIEESTLSAEKEFQETIALAVGVSEFGSGFRTGFANPCFEDPFSCGCDFCNNNPSSPRCAACN